MIFDNKISEDVPVHKVLDYYIENENPHDTLKFLSMYGDDEIKEIFVHSLMVQRIFQLDFVYFLTYDELKYVRKLMDFVSVDEGMYLVWQILQSDMIEKYKSMFRPFLEDHARNRNHPYKGISGEVSKRFDREFITAIGNGDVAGFINSMSIEKFVRYVQNYLVHSVFYLRFFQADVFVKCDLAHSYILLTNGLKNIYSIDMFYKFVKQVLYHPGIIPEIKIEILKNLKTMAFTYVSRIENHDELLKCESYADLLIRLDLYGDDVKEDILLWYAANRPEVIIEVYDNARRYIDEYIPIGDLPKHVKFLDIGNSK